MDASCIENQDSPIAKVAVFTRTKLRRNVVANHKPSSSSDSWNKFSASQTRSHSPNSSTFYEDLFLWATSQRFRIQHLRAIQVRLKSR